MLLLLRLQLFAVVLVSVAFGGSNEAGEQFMRAVIHEPVVEHEYRYHFEYCHKKVPEFSDFCWFTDLPFRTHKKVEDFFVT